MVSHEGENYNVIASGGISLSMEIPNAELSAQGCRSNFQYSNCQI